MLPLISVYYMYMNLPIPLSLSLSLSLSLPPSPIMTHSSHFPSRNGVVAIQKWAFHFNILRIHNQVLQTGSE